VRKFLGILICAGLAAFLAGLVTWVRPRLAPALYPALAGRAERAWVLAEENLNRLPCAGDRFDFISDVTLKGGTAYLAFNAQDGDPSANHLFVRLGGDLSPRTGPKELSSDPASSARSLPIVLGRVEAGLARVLASGHLPEGLPGELRRVEIRRRGTRLAVVVDGRLVLMAQDDAFTGGRAAPVRRGDDVRFDGPRVEARPPAFLADDFMRLPENFGAWERVSGDWKILESNFSVERADVGLPSLSPNAFRLGGRGMKALVLAGEPEWDLYRFAVNVQPVAGSVAGLVFAARDAKNYYLFRWRKRALVVPKAGADAAATLPPPAAEILRVADGEAKVLVRSGTGFTPGQWYRVEVRLGYGAAEVFVDGHPLLSAEGDGLVGGRVGLYATSSAPVLFDDVSVTGLTGLEERFSGLTSTWGSWRRTGGEWDVLPGGGVEARADGAAEALTGSSLWGRYRVEAEVEVLEGRAGLVFHSLDATESARFYYDEAAGRLVLAGVSDGRERPLDQPGLSFSGETPPAPVSVSHTLAPGTHRFAITSDRGHVAALVDGWQVLEGWAAGGAGTSGRPRGRVGLFVAPAAGTARGRAVFRSFRVSFLEEPEPLGAINPVYAEDYKMFGWASAEGDWEANTTGSGGERSTIYWHRARFDGDVELALDLTNGIGKQRGPKDKVEAAKLGLPPPPPLDLALSVAKGGRKRGNGYILRARRAGANAPVGLELTREGEIVARREIPFEDALHAVAVQRAGAYVVGLLDGQAALVWRDPKPLTGRKLAWYARGIEVSPGSVRVTSGTVRDHTFEHAPWEWRSACGVWEVTNRWRCDPRWSFFSGRPASSGGGPSILWSKEAQDGDLVVDLYAAIKHGGNYKQARDINLTIAADGADLDTGYSFLFGGMGNKGSMILRGRKVVQRTDQGIPFDSGTNLHHRWFQIRVEREGATLRFTVWRLPFRNESREIKCLVNMSYTDPEPLTGSRMALWTLNTSGIMVSRVRISGGVPGAFARVEASPAKVGRLPY